MTTTHLTHNPRVDRREHCRDVEASYCLCIGNCDGEFSL